MAQHLIGESMKSYSGVAKAIANVVKENYPEFVVAGTRIINDKLVMTIARK